MSIIDTLSEFALPAPRTLEEAGLSRDLITQLALKMLHFSGELTGNELARRLGLPFCAVESVLATIKQHHHVEISGGALGSASYHYRSTDAGRSRAMLFLEQNHYVGFAPVPLEQYRRYMHAFKAAMPHKVDRASVRKAFSHLVISQRVLDQLGPAINAGHSMFVYGPPGNGKTVISQAIHKLLDGDIFVPHALEVEGSIIRFFDPVNHIVLPEAETTGLDLGGDTDRRWVRCRRPMVMVGGELSLDQLELSYSPALGFYRAPIQAIANGGVLVIDDFGRQRCAPRDLLNRWIVPLESRVDYLTLHTGKKFQVPFDVLTVFATNLDPASLADEAFLRRIPYKIAIQDPSIEDFTRILELNCRRRDLRFHPVMAAYLQRRHYLPIGRPLRACHPRDLLDQVTALCRYRGIEPVLSREMLDLACEAYFLDDKVSQPPTAPVRPRRKRRADVEVR